MKSTTWDTSLLVVMQSRGDGTPYFPQYADGGYPIAYYDKYMEFLCANCATRNLFNDYFDIPKYAEIWYEGAPQECICGKIVESAYGDPEENAILEAISSITRVNNCVSHVPVWREKHTNPYDKKRWLISNEVILRLIRDKIAEGNDDFWNDLPQSALEYISVGSIRAAIGILAREESHNE